MCLYNSCGQVWGAVFARFWQYVSINFEVETSDHKSKDAIRDWTISANSIRVWLQFCLGAAGLYWEIPWSSWPWKRWVIAENHLEFIHTLNLRLSYDGLFNILNISFHLDYCNQFNRNENFLVRFQIYWIGKQRFL